MTSGKIIFFILLLSLLTGSCIKEDYSNCYIAPNLNLVFQYTGDGETDIFSEKIEYVRLYIFEENGTFVEEYELHKNQLTTYQGIRLNLPKGIYQIVCWGNALKYSYFTDTGYSHNYEDHKLFIKGYNTEDKIRTADALYYGVSKLIWENKESSLHILPFTAAHIKMEIYVEGLNLTPRSSLLPYYMIRVRELGAIYNFNMKTEGKQVFFTPDTQTDLTEKITFASFNTLRFNDNNPIAIDIYNEKEEIIYTLELEKFMTENSISVEVSQEVIIPIYIKFAGTDVEVSIAEWDNTHIKPIF